MNSKTKLKLDWATYKASKYAVMTWHYSKTMPSGKLVKVGVWENDIFIGVILFGLGSTPNLSKILNMKNTEVCELVRVALNKHVNPVTKIISIAIKNFLVKKCPGLNAIISYADMDQGHEGIIYKAGNWQHIGYNNSEYILLKNKITHPRSINAKYGTSSITWLQKHVDKNVKRVKTKGKHRYVYFLKKRVKHKGNAITDQVIEGGSNPTNTLQPKYLE